MAVPLPVDIVMGALPLGFKGNLQEFANAIGDAISATVDATFLTGQIGGSMPSYDLGPWANQGEWWFWDPVSGQYQPSDQGTPVGTVVIWGGTGVPTNWLLCDGREVSSFTYSRLYQAIGTTWGNAGGNPGFFNLPPGGRMVINAPGFANPGIGSIGGSNTPMITQPMLPNIDIQTYSITVNNVQNTGGQNTVAGIGTMGNEKNAIWYAQDVNGNPLGQNQIAIPLPAYMACNLVIKYQ